VEEPKDGLSCQSCLLGQNGCRCRKSAQRNKERMQSGGYCTRKKRAKGIKGDSFLPNASDRAEGPEKKKKLNRTKNKNVRFGVGGGRKRDTGTDRQLFANTRDAKP